MPRFTPLAADLPSTVPFVGPENTERARGRSFRARLGANENVFGPSPKAIEAMQKCAAEEAWCYGDPESFALRDAIAEHHNVGVENVVVGEGIDGLLGTLTRLLVQPGTPVVTSLGAYPTFNFQVAACGGALHAVPYRDWYEDPDALAAKTLETNAPLTYLVNPDNPMGTFHQPAVITKLVDQLPDDGLLCLDEAYCEFAPQDELLPIDVSNTKLIRLRTFSKAYGMAGARMAYAIGHADLIGAFNKVRNHFGVNRIGQAGALAALGDRDWLTHCVSQIADANARLADIARDNGLAPLGSHANFVAMDTGRDGAFSKAVVEAFAARDIFIRMPGVAPLNRHIRISAGTEHDLDIIAEAMPAVLEEADRATSSGA
ncbi:pyridoxal phosphate-dependent aminotransferase [Ahrensia sp. R2A130]|uniref:pyridoxal phosphate-dependent aminotransferase n=1 Tax=Ahrensia sp. R2A130 TaxID=744979 RepID=UPI00058F572D|nr:pyridoxal phosphate-dependent aminotransferase [Ahrensia sp. R2A130]